MNFECAAMNEENKQSEGFPSLPYPVAYILVSKATGSRDLVWPSVADNYSEQSYRKIPLYE